MKTWPLVSIIGKYFSFLYVALSFNGIYVGAIMVIAGQTLRSAAMITASTNFNHSVQFKKAESHRLVTEGVYSWV
jgi:protein-S-isoprenylcysteine O-methyltransferase Ste14